MIAEGGNKTLLCLIMLLSAFLPVKAQNGQSCLCVQYDTLMSQIVQIKVPCDFKKKKHIYDEGEFIDYIFKSGAVITLFKGALHKKPLLSEDAGYFVQKKDTANNRLKITGEKDNKLWREDAIGDIIIYYDRVPIEMKKLYDVVLDSLYIMSLPK